MMSRRKLSMRDVLGACGHRARASLVAVTLVSGWGLAGCSGHACKELKAQHAALLTAQRQTASEASPEQVVMALAVDQAMVGELLAEAMAEVETQASKTLEVAGGQARVKLRVPRLDVSLTDACDDCVALDGKVSVTASLKVAGVSLGESRVSGRVQARAPLKLVGGAEGSRLVLGLDGIKIRQIDLDLDGLPAQLRKEIRAYATEGARTILGQLSGELPLASWAPIEVPGGGVALTASKLAMFPQQGQLWVGFSATLPARGPALTPAPLLGQGERVGVTLSGTALEGLMQRMMDAGGLPARLDDDFKPSASGDNHVTLRSVVPERGKLKTAFTVWHLPDDGACYAADLEGMASIKLRHKPARGEHQLDLSIKRLEVTRTQGEDTLLRVGLWLRSAFVDEALEAQARVMAADTLSLGPLGQRQLRIARIALKPEGVTVAGDMVKTAK